MQFFIDTADLNEIKSLSAAGFVDGVTTNPSLVAQSGKNFLDLVRDITKTIPGPVSAEVTAGDFDTIMLEAKKLSAIAKNVVIKLPLTEDGLKACRALTDKNIKTNVTLCFSAAQALLAAKAGATYISPFVGRLDDIGEDGMQLVRDIVEIYRNYPELKTKVLAASIRNADHVKKAALAGAHVATIPPKIVREMIKHSLTDKGLEKFAEDWKKTGQSIL
jgi:transaldolase